VASGVPPATAVEATGLRASSAAVDQLLAQRLVGAMSPDRSVSARDAGALREGVQRNFRKIYFAEDRLVAGLHLTECA
jgi:hypothetical protein